MERSNSSINLICLPYAGGSKYSYSSFSAVAPVGINVVPLELPGRGDRLGESLLADLHSMADDLFVQLKKYTSKPYLVYGHSMGGILGYLVVKKISDTNLPLPQYLIITGCEGPSVKDDDPKLRSHLPADKFIEELEILGGTSHIILKDQNVFDFFEPILRADFRAIEEYKYTPGTPLNVPICAIYGSEEDISFEEALTWQKESNFEVEVVQFPGDHFFIFKHEKEIMKIIENKIIQQKKRIVLEEKYNG